MNTLFDEEQLRRLIANLKILTGHVAAVELKAPLGGVVAYLALVAGDAPLVALGQVVDMEKLSLASISRHLHIGRTKLCAIAKELSGLLC